MASSESSSNPILWIGGAILAAGYAILGGYWLYAITTADDVPVLVLRARVCSPAVLGGIFAVLTPYPGLQSC